MGSEINSKKWGEIWDHSTGIWEHKPWDRDQHYCKEIKDPVVQHNNKDPNILKCALLEEPANIFQFSCIFAVIFRSSTKLY